MHKAQPLAWISLACMLTACQTTAEKQADVKATWADAAVAIPADIRGDKCVGGARTGCLGELTPAQKLPVIVYMHGCSGQNYTVMQDFMRLGYVTVGPSSFSRSGRKMDCAVLSDKKPIVRMRIEEAVYAAQSLKALPWVDAKRLILAGHSEGGVTTALYPGDEYAARIIMGWTCTSSDPWWDGIRGPSGTPVLAVVGSKDHYYQNKYNAGHCRVAGRPNSSSVVLQGSGHDIFPLPQTWAAIEEFLKRAP